PYRLPHMARGQGGSLFLPCTTLSFVTPCRFIPALSRLPACGPPLAGLETLRGPGRCSTLAKGAQLRISRHRCNLRCANLIQIRHWHPPLRRTSFSPIRLHPCC